MTKENARSVALDCLMLTVEEGQFSHAVLNGARAKYAWMTPEDRSFFTRLVHGTLEYMIQADRILDARSSVKVRKMKPAVRNILRMSVYQLLYLDRIPARAVINEAVNLTAARGLHGLKGFVNAVLRRISSEREMILKDIAESKDLTYKYSCPGWIVSLLVKQYGRERAEGALAAFLEPQPLWFRRNRTAERLSEEASAVPGPAGSSENAGSSSADGSAETGARSDNACPWDPDIFELRDGGKLKDPELLTGGAGWIQDLSSAIAVRAAAPAPGMTVIDLCAAPGGKSMAAADLMGNTGLIRAFDLTEAKVELIRENASRNGFSCIQTAENDARIFREDLEGTADLVIADLPCSGLGVIGRKPDIRRNASPEGIASLAALQREILSAAVRYVKPGGKLLFSTCTMTFAENDENRAWILASFPDFTPVDLSEGLPLPAEVPGAETLKEGYFQILPGALPCDGFFFSLFRKTGGGV